ncbi:MAG: hypothetical protein RQ842_02100 [Vulcanisaeta sp.]|nr:hypothetical protein [Vulcanisaeta sp.]
MPAPKINEALIEEAREIMVRRLMERTDFELDDAEYIRILKSILTKEQALVRVRMNNWFYAVVSDKDGSAGILIRLDYLPFAIATEAIQTLNQHAVKKTVHYDAVEYLVCLNNAVKSYIARLAILSYLAFGEVLTNSLHRMVDKLYREIGIRRQDVDDVYMDLLTRGCDPTDILCMIRNTIKARDEIRKKAMATIERRVGWLRKIVERHNFIATRLASALPITGIRPAENLGEFSDIGRAYNYLQSYPSYVELKPNGEVIYALAPDPDLKKPVLTAPIITGVNSGSKFTRLVLNIVTLRERELTFRVDGSWMVGVDKATKQPFAIALPRKCAIMTIRTCEEYILGLRDDNLHPTVEDLDAKAIIITEV